jgi:hypothetical protein
MNAGQLGPSAQLPRINLIVVAALIFGGALFIVNALAYGAGDCDGDLWWQRELGDAVLRTHRLPATLGAGTFSAPGARWIPHEWVFATAWSFASRSGAQVFFALGCAGIALFTLIVESMRTRGSSALARAFTIVLIGAALIPSFGLRAQVLAWPLLALVLLALESGPRRAWFALPISIVWYNLHASALIVPCIVLVDGIGRAIDERRLSTLLGRSAVAVACALASLVTPFGIALPRFIVGWSTNSATSLIYEWMPAAPDKILIIAGACVIAALLVIGELRGARLSWAQRLPGLILFGATLLHIRNLGPFCIVAGPWVAAAVTVLLRSTPIAEGNALRRDLGPALLTVAAAIGLVVMGSRVPPDHGLVTPAVAEVTALHRPLRVACEDFAWCSRFAGSPQVRVFVDGRTDAYPDPVFADYRRVLRGDALPVFTRWNIDTAIVHANGPLARALRAAHWRLLRRREPQVYLRPGRIMLREQAKFERAGRVFAGELGRPALDEGSA